MLATVCVLQSSYPVSCQQRLSRPKLTPLNINMEDSHGVMEVWCRSFSFLFMGDLQVPAVNLPGCVLENLFVHLWTDQAKGNRSIHWRREEEKEARQQALPGNSAGDLFGMVKQPFGKVQ